jgi:serine/threonine protein kinase
MDNLIGQSFGRYQILEQLGEGGMAIVYKAYDTRLERDVAIKIIRRGAFPPDQLTHILKRFEREAKALAKLSHPNIVRVLDYGDHAGAPYLVMEYLHGGTLKRQLGKPMPWREAVQILIPISQALEYAHQHKVLHRDIKPANILLTEKGQPMLTDFGIAKVLEVQETATLTGSGMVVGTPEYMAPEQWTGQTTQQSDIYSLAVVLYEMVTGRKPYIADTPAAIFLKQVTDPLPRPKQYVRNLPDEVEKILLKALSKEASDRYQDMSALIRALESLLAGKVPVPSGRGRAEETVNEWETETRTTPFERTPTGSTRLPSRSNLMRFLPWVAAVLCFAVTALAGVFGVSVWWNSASNGARETSTPIVEIGLPVPADTSPSIDPVVPTNTSFSTSIPQLSPTDPPILIDPPILTPVSFTATSDMFCYDGPGTGYESHWELYIGQTAAVFKKWSGDSNWIAVDINDDKTRTDCCWVESRKGTLNVSLDEIEGTSILPDRMDCSAIK